MSAVAAAALLATPWHDVLAQSAGSPPPVPREFRGVWVASVGNIDWPSKPGLPSFEQQAELIAILDRAHALNLNAVLLQVRPAADALYASKLEPWSAFLTGLEGRAPEPYYDPLEFAVREAHARGLELHAWVNPYRAKYASATSPHAATHIATTHPALVHAYGKAEWIDPGEPAVLTRSLAVILDIVKRYDIDGIHIDDYFYPYPENGADGQVLEFPDGKAYAAYAKRGGTLARDDWRRQNVDLLVAALYARTKALKPHVQVGISPFGIWRPGYPAQIKGFDSYAKLYADARHWLREGWIDYFTPQLYWPIAQVPQAYPVLLDWWMGENVKGRHLWPGHYTTRGANPTGAWSVDEISNQVRATRAAKAGGDIHFSMRPLMPSAAMATAATAAPAAQPARRDSAVPLRRDSAPQARRDSAPQARRDSALPATSTAALGAAPSPTPASAAMVPAPIDPLFDRLKRDVYQVPALAPATPWLETRGMPAPGAAIGADTASREIVVRMSPGAGRAVAHWTVRVFAHGAWRTFILPGAERQVVVAPAGDVVERAVVTAVDRVGIESAVVVARAPIKRLAMKARAAVAPVRKQTAGARR